MSDRGKQIIANMAAKLAPTRQNKILVSAHPETLSFWNHWINSDL